MRSDDPGRDPHASTEASLKQSTIKGGAFVFGSMLIQKGLNLVILAIMARLLTPSDYGLLGMIFALTALLSIFVDMGLPLASVQKAELTFPQLSTMFWINMALGFLLAAVTIFLAPLVAGFYHQPVLANATAWYAVNFPLAALGAQHGALLQRRMAFDKFSLAEVAGLTAGGIVGIWMAFRGAGVYALIGQQIALTGTTSLGNWYFTRWCPGLPRRGTGVRSMVKLGGFLTAYNFVNHFTRNLDKILLGRYFGAGPVGLYTRAYALMTYPMSLISAPIGRVAIPALAKLQGDQARMRVAYLRVLKVIGMVTFPMTILTLAAGEDIITVIYGARWKEAVPLFQILCIVGMWQGIYNAAGQVFVASGRTDRMFKAGLVVSVITAGSFIVGLKWGAVGVASAYAAGFTAMILPYLAYTYATVGLSLAVVLRELKLPFAAAVGTAPFLWGVRVALHDAWLPWVRVVLLSAVAIGLYFSFLFLFGRSFLGAFLRELGGSGSGPSRKSGIVGAMLRFTGARD